MNTVGHAFFPVITQKYLFLMQRDGSFGIAAKWLSIFKNSLMHCLAERPKKIKNIYF
jgi:hypothetical protein